MSDIKQAVCCMCPGAICPGIEGTPHPRPSPCRVIPCSPERAAEKPPVRARLIPSGKFGAIDPLCQTECSNCGCGHVGIVYSGSVRYCPNCGAELWEGGADHE